MTDDVFSSWPLADEEPGWRQRGLVVGTFAVGGVLAGALSAALPLVDFHLRHLLQAGLLAALPALPLSAALARAGRRRDLGEVTLFSLALAALGYAAFAVEIAVIDAAHRRDGREPVRGKLS